MKHVLSFFTISLFVIGFFQTSTFSQTKFEGKIVMKMTDGDNTPSTIEYYVKDNKMRVEGQEEGMRGAMVIDYQNKKMMIIMPEQKMYIEYPFGSAMDKEQTSQTAEKKEEGNFKMTGETKVILGYKSEKIIYTDKDGTQDEAWITKGLGRNLLMGDPMKDKNQPEWQKKLVSEGFLPMIVITKDSDGKIKSKLEVISIEKRSLDGSLFTHPADYKKMEMPSMNK